jgi:hypothetical protein
MRLSVLRGDCLVFKNLVFDVGKFESLLNTEEKILNVGKFNKMKVIMPSLWGGVQASLT